MLNLALDKVERGEIKRLMVFMPPGHAKSTYASKAFPARYLGKHPDHQIIAGSHTRGLAKAFGRGVRHILKSREWSFGDVTLSADSSGDGEWRTNKDGGYFAVGAGGGVHGRRANGVIIDDPYRNRKDADSKTIREAVLQWYKIDLRTRLKPDGWIILIQTRWRPDDVSGSILPKTWSGETGWVTSTEGERWYVLCLPAIAEKNDPLGRKVGEPLWPEYYRHDLLMAQKGAMSARDWDALYQQKPKPDEGAIIKIGWWNPWGDREIALYGKVPRCDIRMLSVDTAYTEKEEGSYSAVTLWGRWRDEKRRPNVILLYAWRDRLELPDLVVKLQDLIGRFKPSRIVIENKAAGLPAMQELRRRLTACPIVAFDPRAWGDKVARGYAVQGVFESGAVWTLDRAWAGMVIEECAEFPRGENNDLYDTVTQALLHLRMNRTALRLDETDERYEAKLRPKAPKKPLYGVD
jgi:predicted phage terminase large subunit-like protein